MTAHLNLLRDFDGALKGDAVPAGITAKDPDETAQRFNVYRNNVATSLIDALGARFPVIRRLVGDEFFGAMARVFIDIHRPQSPLLMHWGAEFPAFLRRFPPLGAYPYMGDVAWIEYTRGQAFHAADAEPLDAETLLSANPETLVLDLHPSVTVLRLKHPGVSIWTRNQPGRSDTPLGSGPEIALIFRDRSFGVPVVAVSPADAALVDGLAKRQPLAQAAASAQLIDPNHNPQAVLVTLMQAGAIIQRGSPE